MSDIEGIPQEKLDRLWMHLEKAEKMIGGKLRKKMRFDDFGICPLSNFAPDQDTHRNEFDGSLKKGIICYCGSNPQKYKVYTFSDSAWWSGLPEITHIQITKWVMKKIKERNKIV